MSLKTIQQILRTGIVSRFGNRASVGQQASPQIQTDPAAQQIGADIVRLFGQSLAIRALDAGSCNGCELELHALNNPYYNLEGMGIRFVASPRHADLLLVTGPVTSNMALAVQRTYDAMPEPRLVVAVGDCASCGGEFGETYASRGKVGNLIPVNVLIRSCPPAPIDILRGILEAVSARNVSR